MAVQPVGASEAHGPHLPLGTDGIIAEAMAREGARRLETRDFVTLLLPTIHLTPAPFAAGFAGTLTVGPEALRATVVAVGRSLAGHGFRILAIANAHLDPANLAALHDAVDTLASETGLRIAFPDLTRRPWASRLGDEFRSGACHAGRYETSIVLAERPDLVRDEERMRLPASTTSLSRGIAEGKTTFEELGGDRAYFGDPAAATAAEGRERIEALGRILEEAVVERTETEG